MADSTVGVKIFCLILGLPGIIVKIVGITVKQATESSCRQTKSSRPYGISSSRVPPVGISPSSAAAPAMSDSGTPVRDTRRRRAEPVRFDLVESLVNRELQRIH
jgi:hypothetical protein